MSATCEFCDKQFTKASNMRKHAEKFHFAYKRKMRPGSQRSPVWQHFEKVSGPGGKVTSVKCKVCQKTLKYFANTTNLASHLKRIHPLQAFNSPESPSDENEPIDEPSAMSVSQSQVSSADNRQPLTPITNNVPSTSTTSASSSTAFDPPKRRQRQLVLVGKNGNISQLKKKSIDACLMKMITVDYQPLSVVEDVGFRELVSNLNPCYELPSRKQLSTKMLPELYLEKKMIVKKMLGLISDLAITTDLWTSDSTKSYIAVTAHFIFDGHLRHYNLNSKQIEGSHTGENIANTLKTIFDDWGIKSKILTAVTDNGANVKNAINEKLKLRHHPCVAHTLNLCVVNSIQGNDDLNVILNKCRSLVTHFKMSTLASDKLREVQIRLKVAVLRLKKDVATRWNAVLIMIERLCEVKDSLSMALLSLPGAPAALSTSEWVILEEVILVLKPFETLTTVMSGEKYVTLSMIPPLIRGLQLTLRRVAPASNCAIQLKTSLMDSVSKRLAILEQDKTISKATFLDPRFKKIGFGNDQNAENAEMWVTEELTILLNKKKAAQAALQKEAALEPAPTPLETDTEDPPALQPAARKPEDDIWEYYDRKVAQVKSSSTPASDGIITVRQYLQLPLLERKENPLVFWENRKLAFPDLYTLSQKYLCAPATSVPSERVFSKAGLLTNARRNRLDPKNLDMIIFTDSFQR